MLRNETIVEVKNKATHLVLRRKGNDYHGGKIMENKNAFIIFKNLLL